MKAIVSDEDLDWIVERRWCAWPGGRLASGELKFYAGRALSVSEGKGKGVVFMHRAILRAPRGVEVDHINGNSLDNRRENLRLATSSQNKINRGKYLVQGERTSSRFKGVCWDFERQTWVAHIKIDGKNLKLGRFKVETEAAKAYADAARRAWGEYARFGP